jgi:hypothetical protein
MRSKSPSPSPRPTRVRRRTLARAGALSLAAVTAAAGTSCLERPVAPQKPATSNQFVDTVKLSSVDKIDLLFMVDSSKSMADKQLILEQAVPVLLRRLITPDCLDASEMRTGQRAVDGACPPGTHPEFRPIEDIHVGVISSSLGAAGGTECQNGALSDRGQLVPTVAMPGRPALNSWNGSGFLAWDPRGTKNTPPGENDLENLMTDFRAHIVGTGESGCGFEASLEAWYRFLIDPDPPIDVSLGPDPATGFPVAVRGMTNTELLDQRAKFLRPDSLLAIVMLSDENDCSIVDLDGTQGFLAANTGDRMPRASSACATDPNSPCCRTCAAPVPDGCPSNAEDAECQKPAYSMVEDNGNMRCFDQKRRFGVDRLHSVERYVRGLRDLTVPDRKGNPVTNPIYAAPPGMPPRDPGLVFLAGIVGVPWQDVATDASRAGTDLEYLSARELGDMNRWPMIVGDRAKNQPPSDPLMVESIAPRSGVNPITGDALAPMTAMGLVNPINGHEQNVIKGDDLQYACIFPLLSPRDCDGVNPASCDCTASEEAYNRPLCDYDRADGVADGFQTHAKAYPGTRQLEVLRGVGDQGIVASICPRYVTAAPQFQSADDDPNYGYNPAVTTIIDNIKLKLGDRCLPRQLTPELTESWSENGRVPCLVTEATRVPAGGACSCDAPGRSPLDGDHAVARRAILDEAELDGQCGGGTGIDCEALCLCEVDQLVGDELAACREGTESPESYGYCYVDPEQGLGADRLVAECRPTQRRKLRFVGEGLPQNRSIVTIACLGASFSEDAE